MPEPTSIMVYPRHDNWSGAFTSYVRGDFARGQRTVFGRVVVLGSFAEGQRAGEGRDA